MGSAIYFIICILFLIHIFWTWNNTKSFENIWIRISYLLIGTLFMTFITFIIFQFSKMGVEYPKQEMVGQVRKIVMLLFVPINSFIIFPQVASLIARVKNGDISVEDRDRKTRILFIVFGIMIIVECVYFKSIQNGIISTYINLGQG